MAQKNGWERVRIEPRERLVTRMTATPESQAISTLLLVALSLFVFLALGNYAGLW